jgi:hypothetical protein
MTHEGDIRQCNQKKDQKIWALYIKTKSMTRGVFGLIESRGSSRSAQKNGQGVQLQNTGTLNSENCEQSDLAVQGSSAFFVEFPVAIYKLFRVAV